VKGLPADRSRAGKQWHDNKPAFRPRANQSSWEKRTAERKSLAAVKAKEKEMKEEKEAEKQVWCHTSLCRGCELTMLQRRTDAIRTKRAAKEERERFQKMEEKMHKRRVERLKRREKRNKMLKS
jgi:rRNA-processing protein CGR1